MQLFAEQVGENYSQAIDEKLDWMSECIPLLYESGESKTLTLSLVFFMKQQLNQEAKLPVTNNWTRRNVRKIGKRWYAETSNTDERIKCIIFFIILYDDAVKISPLSGENDHFPPQVDAQPVVLTV